MRFRKRLIFLIVSVVAASEISELRPGPEVAMGNLPELPTSESWDAYEITTMRSLFDEDPIARPFSWSDGLSLLRERPDLLKKKEPTVTGLLSGPKVQPRPLPPPVLSRWAGNGSTGWPGGHNGIQRYIEDRGEIAVNLPTNGAPPDGVGSGVGSGGIPGVGVPGVGDGGLGLSPPTGFPVVGGFPILLPSDPSPSVGNPGTDPPLTAVPEPAYLTFATLLLWVLRRRRAA